MLWLSKESSCFRSIALLFVYHVLALYAVNLKNLHWKKRKKFLDEQLSERTHGKRKEVQLKWQLPLFIDSQSIKRKIESIANAAQKGHWVFEWEKNNFLIDLYISCNPKIKLDKNVSKEACDLLYCMIWRAQLTFKYDDHIKS